MSKVEIIEDQVSNLSPDELKSFREWFTRFDADAWDGQFESDVNAGKLDKLADEALRDYEAGRTSEL